jgi:hypothetical protein
MKVNYESKVDWRQASNYLRCNPRFHGHLRQDFVIIEGGLGGPIFAQLLFVFKCTIAAKEYSLALVQSYDEHIPASERPKKDADLDLFRVRARPRKSSEFIFLDSIIRGALLVDSFDSEHGDEKLVVDIVDTDMFLRLLSSHGDPSQL